MRLNNRMNSDAHATADWTRISFNAVSFTCQLENVDLLLYINITKQFLKLIAFSYLRNHVTLKM